MRERIKNRNLDMSWLDQNQKSFRPTIVAKIRTPLFRLKYPCSSFFELFYPQKRRSRLKKASVKCRVV